MDRIILIGVELKRQDYDFEEMMDECLQLCEACDYEVVETVTQKMDLLDRQTCVGSGKVVEISELCDDLEVDGVVFLNRLSSSQVSHLQEAFGCDVLDRTGLILEIFAKRAKTKEAQIQVEMATLQYELPRLMSMDGQSDQQRGGSGVKNKGKGETKLELGKRNIERRISQLRKELEVLEVQTEIQKQQRNKSKLPLVALVGYTNAGKSSLMNRLLKKNEVSDEKQVFEKDMLFATLDTSVRNVKFDSKREFLLFDTVGFVSHLPTELIEAFKSTLSAAKEAKLLLHVIDSASEHMDAYIEATEKTLKKIGASDIPVVKVYNKKDLALDHQKEDGIAISCKTEEGIDELLHVIEEMLYPSEQVLECVIPYSDLACIAKLKESALVQFLEDSEKGRRLKVVGPKEVLQTVIKYKEDIENE